MVTLDIHFSSCNGIPFYIVVYGFYAYHFSVSKIFLKLQCHIYLKLGYITYSSASANVRNITLSIYDTVILEIF